MINPTHNTHKQNLGLAEVPELGTENTNGNGNPPPPPPSSNASAEAEPEESPEDRLETKPKRLDWFWAGVALIFWGTSLVSTYLSFALLLGVNGGNNVKIPIFGRYVPIDRIVSVMGTGILEGGSLYLAFEKRKEDEEETND